MESSLNQEFLKAKYREYSGSALGIHQRAHDYKKLWGEDIALLGFLLVECESAEIDASEPNSLRGLREAVQVVISEKIAKRQEEMVIKLDKAASALTWVGIFLAAVGAIGATMSLIL